MSITNANITPREEIISKTELYVQSLLNTTIPTEMAALKNREAAKILKNTEKLLKSIQLNNNDKTALLLAVIFTNSGFSESLKEPFLNNEKIAREYLISENVEDEIIEKTLECLRVKSGEKKVETQLEEIYEDGQNSIFADKKYIQKILPAIQKRNKIDDKNPIKTRVWLKKHRNDLKSIDFNTKQAKKRYKSGIKENIKAIEVLRDIKKRKIPVFETPLDNSKGVQMMFKASLRNHIDLTSIADNKASIMLSINAIIITIAMPLLIRYMGDNGYLAIPMIILMLTCVLSIIFAALATRPMKSDGETDVDKVMEKPSANLFFFGNFYNISLPDYQRGLKKVIRSGEVLERSAINDLYFLGKALGDKFNLLRICYMVFMVGIVASVLAYGVVLYLTC